MVCSNKGWCIGSTVEQLEYEGCTVYIYVYSISCCLVKFEVELQ